MTTAPLTDTEREMLAFARKHWRYKGQQDDAIRTTFDISPTRFWQQMLALVERPEALAHDPVTVHRLQRIFGRTRTG